jgi:hypothetical protein
MCFVFSTFPYLTALQQLRTAAAGAWLARHQHLVKFEGKENAMTAAEALDLATDDAMGSPTQPMV